MTDVAVEELLKDHKIVEFLKKSGITVCTQTGELLNVIEWTTEQLKERGEI